LKVLKRREKIKLDGKNENLIADSGQFTQQLIHKWNNKWVASGDDVVVEDLKNGAIFRKMNERKQKIH
jgi:hypothetical protein